jgi:ribosome biogenesis GTPase
VNTLIGLVVRTDGPQVTVRDGDGHSWRCVLRGRLRQELNGTTNPVAVGDRVEVDVVGPQEGAVRKVLPRQAQLVRRAPRDKSAPEQVLAANLDVAVIVVACPPRPTVIDRFLAIAAKGAPTVLVCANKVDLADPARVDDILEPYRLAAVPVAVTSAVTGEGLEVLRAAVDGRLVAFIGPSGTGKSSLINALDPGLHLRVSALARSGRGSHTTSWAAVYPVGSALVVDTPGLREVGFVGDEGAEAADDLFPEISALAGGCHFRDCSHTHEPQCAVKAALDAGDLDEPMYRRYARLARNGRL